MELNGLTDAQNDSCALTVVTTNRLDGGLKRAA